MGAAQEEEERGQKRDTSKVAAPKPDQTTTRTRVMTQPELD